jgi:TetR/AcrR family transcriptional repressor of bet genes
MTAGARRAPPRTRASKAARRGQLIAATLAALEQKGLAALTLADVADAAGLSRGIVNFHFESKDKLLFATLSQLSEDYARNWRAELAAAGPTPAERMRALIAADLAEAICTPQTVAAWFAFFAEAAARPDFRDLCWARDDAYLEAIREVCAALDREAGYGIDPAATATAIYAMQEGLWLRLMMGNAEIDRDAALAIALGMLGNLFPRHFARDGAVLPRGHGLSPPSGR